MLRKNSVRARKTMEMQSLVSLASCPPDCHNPGASCDQITMFLGQNRFSTNLGLCHAEP